MRIRSVSSVSYKSLACVGLVVAFYALAGNVCLAQQRVDRSIEFVEPVDSPMIACLEPCHDATCINNCVATQPLSLGRRVALRTSPQSSVSDCFSGVSDNIRACGQAFLVPIEDADWERFYFCQAVATIVFVGCPAFESSLDPISTLELGTYCLDRTVQIAENTVAQAQAGQLEPLTPSGNGAVLYERTDIQKGSTALTNQAGGVGAGISVQVVQIFTKCIDGYDANVSSCLTRYPQNGGEIRERQRKICILGAEARFMACAKGKIETP